MVHGEDIMVKFKALQSAKVTEKVTEKVAEKVTESLSENEKKIFEILRKDPTATYLEIADKLDISRKTVAQRVRMLKDKGLIVRIGSAKKGYWIEKGDIS